MGKSLVRLFPILFSVLFLGSCVSQSPTLGLNSTVQEPVLSASLNTNGTLEDGSLSVDGQTDISVTPQTRDEDTGKNIDAGNEIVAVPARSPRNVLALAEQKTDQAATASNAALSKTNDKQRENKSLVAAEAVNPQRDATQTAALALNSPSVTGPTTKRSGIFRLFQQRKSNPPRPKTSVFRVNRKKPRTSALNALPGVKSNSELFGINEGNEDIKATMVASVGSLGRLSPNGLRVQHEGVRVDCLKPGVLKILKIVENRYRSKPIITSGYRSPKGNRRAGGARNSMHIFCKAVDIQVEGVSKWQLAKYLRTIPGRGGVGTYCRTNSVHIDIGEKRDWHHPCRRSSVRKRKRS